VKSDGKKVVFQVVVYGFKSQMPQIGTEEDMPTDRISILLI
jgi:hypothetical protein